MRKDRVKPILKYLLKSTRIEYDRLNDVTMIYTIFDDDEDGESYYHLFVNNNKFLYYVFKRSFYDYCRDQFDLTIDEAEYMFEIYIKILRQKIDKVRYN